METLGGLKRTGRRVRGPAVDLVECVADNGLKHTALVYHPEYRDHPRLGRSLQGLLGFLEAPGVSGLVALASHAPDEGAFIYPTGGAWSVAEVIRLLADQGEALGVRAGLELAYLAGTVLLEASEAARNTDAICHGAVDPWRLLIKPDGQVLVIGFGLPPVEMIDYQGGSGPIPNVDAFRYCPPERIQQGDEDLSSDLLSLTLVVLEAIVGQPVYDGLPADVRLQAARGEGARRLYEWRTRIPAAVHTALSRALAFEKDARFEDGANFLYEIHDLLSAPDVQGPGLAEWMRRLEQALRAQQAVEGGKTGMFGLPPRREEVESAPIPPPNRPRPEEEDEPGEVKRWTSRGGRRGAKVEEPPPPEPAPSARDALRRSWEGPPRGVRDSGGETPRRGGDAPRRAGKDDAPPRLGRSGDREVPRRLDESGGRGDLPRRLDESASRAAGDVPARLTRSGERDLPRRMDESARREVPRRLDESASRTSGEAPARLETPRREESPRGDAPRRLGREPEPTPEPARAAGGWRDRVRAQGEKRPEESKTIGPSDDGSVRFQVRRTDGSLRPARLKPAQPLAEAAARLIEAFGGAPTDLTGHLLGWFRIRQEGRTWRGDTPVSVLDPSVPLDLEWVPATTVLAELRVTAPSGEVRFQAPVNTVLPLRLVTAHLGRWLHLPEQPWVATVDGVTLGPFQILAELEPRDGVVIRIHP